MPFQPFLVDIDRVQQGKSVYSWEPERPIVLGLIPRHDLLEGEVRWITLDIEPQYVMHTMSANIER